MDEFTLIDHFLKPIAGSRDDVLLGIGDDGAVVRPPAGEELVIVTDTLVAGIHFPLALAPVDIGYRALAVNLSDIAAMGGTPLWATLALTIPEADETWLRAFADGFSLARKAHQLSLVGGDTTRGPLTITVQLIGALPPGSALTRSGAEVGDAIYVSGTLGDAAAGLEVLQRGTPHSAEEEFLVARFARPTPRIALGLALRGIATSCIDISDGLLADLGHIATASGRGARIEVARLPISPACRSVFAKQGVIRFATAGGDDYELCFTLPNDTDVRRLEDTTPIHRIGVMTEGPPGVVAVDEQERVLALRETGFNHFAENTSQETPQ
ncbi:MAG: thiamine-phosphate kinase, partial [Gammaproteobacteria bacterium]